MVIGFPEWIQGNSTAIAEPSAEPSAEHMEMAAGIGCQLVFTTGRPTSHQSHLAPHNYAALASAIEIITESKLAISCFVFDFNSGISTDPTLAASRRLFADRRA